MEELKKLIWVYLCETFPNARRRVTKWGCILISENDNHGRISEIRTIATLFSCEYEFAEEVFSEFVLTRPMFKPLNFKQYKN